MSVTTTADIKIASLKEHINESIYEIQHILDVNTWGNVDLSTEYLKILQETWITLQDLKIKL